MGTKREEGIYHIDGNEIYGIPDWDAEFEPVKEYIHDNIQFITNDGVTYTAKLKMDPFLAFKLLGLWQWVCCWCPDPRVVHLMKYGKKHKTRKKNFRRAFRLIGKTYYKN